MQDNPFYNYYRGELNEWQDYAEANAFKITDAEASEYGLKFNLSGIKYSRFFKYTCSIRYNNAGNSVVPVRSRIIGNGKLLLQDKPDNSFWIINKPRFFTKIRAHFLDLNGVALGAYTMFTENSYRISEAESKTLNRYKVKSIKASTDEVKIDVFKYLNSNELEALIELYTLLKEKAS